MNTQEMIYKLIEYFFSDLFHFILLIMFILIIKSDTAKVINNLKGFIKKIIVRYRTKNKIEYIKNNIPKDLKKIISE